MDPEEIARRELERLEKKKRKQEKRLLRSQNKLLSGELFHTPGSDSDSGVSHITDSEQSSLLSDLGRNQTQPSCDQTPQKLQNQRNPNQDASGSELDSSDSSQQSNLSSNGRASTIQKLNPFSVESLLSDSRPRRKPAVDFPTLPSPRPLIGKGHFLLYPITQPLGFIVPQTSLKPSASGPESENGIQRGSQSENLTINLGHKNINDSDHASTNAAAIKGQNNHSVRNTGSPNGPTHIPFTNNQSAGGCNERCLQEKEPDNVSPISPSQERSLADYSDTTEPTSTSHSSDTNKDSVDVDMG